MILEREEGGERERDNNVREKHQSIVSGTRPHPQPGTKRANFWCMEEHSNQLNHTLRATFEFFRYLLKESDSWNGKNKNKKTLKRLSGPI